MPRTINRIHNRSSGDAKSSQKYARQLREVYVPSRLRRWVNEEGALMLAFDGSKDIKTKLEVLGGLIRIRLLILRGIGWPKEPALKGGRVPCSLENVKAHDPLGDIDVAAVVQSSTDPETLPDRA